MKISAIVLAAGRSRRMGTQKLLLPLDGRPMIAVIADQLERCRLDEVIVVTRPGGSAVRQALAGRNLRVVINNRGSDEMLESVRCGLNVVRGDAAGVMVVLGDQPVLSADVVDHMVHAFGENPQGIVIPTFDGRRGHPMLFALRYRDEILTNYDGRGLRGLLESHPEEVREVEAPTRAILDDVDTPEDYRRAIGQLEAGP